MLRGLGRWPAASRSHFLTAIALLPILVFALSRFDGEALKESKPSRPGRDEIRSSVESVAPDLPEFDAFPPGIVDESGSEGESAATKETLAALESVDEDPQSATLHLLTSARNTLDADERATAISRIDLDRALDDPVARVLMALLQDRSERMRHVAIDALPLPRIRAADCVAFLVRAFRLEGSANVRTHLLEAILRVGGARRGARGGRSRRNALIPSAWTTEAGAWEGRSAEALGRSRGNTGRIRNSGTEYL